jgi:hypothetical protein
MPLRSINYKKDWVEKDTFAVRQARALQFQPYSCVLEYERFIQLD